MYSLQIITNKAAHAEEIANDWNGERHGKAAYIKASDLVEAIKIEENARRLYSFALEVKRTRLATERNCL